MGMVVTDHAARAAVVFVVPKQVDAIITACAIAEALLAIAITEYVAATTVGGVGLHRDAGSTTAILAIGTGRAAATTVVCVGELIHAQAFARGETRVAHANAAHAGCCTTVHTTGATVIRVISHEIRAVVAATGFGLTTCLRPAGARVSVHAPTRTAALPRSAGRVPST